MKKSLLVLAAVTAMLVGLSSCLNTNDDYQPDNSSFVTVDHSMGLPQLTADALPDKTLTVSGEVPDFLKELDTKRALVIFKITAGDIEKDKILNINIVPPFGYKIDVEDIILDNKADSLENYKAPIPYLNNTSFPHSNENNAYVTPNGDYLCLFFGDSQKSKTLLVLDKIEEGKIYFNLLNKEKYSAEGFRVHNYHLTTIFSELIKDEKIKEHKELDIIINAKTEYGDESTTCKMKNPLYIDYKPEIK